MVSRRQQAKRDAEKDDEENVRCPHPAPWNSEGPLAGGVVKYTCSKCGKSMGTKTLKDD